MRDLNDGTHNCEPYELNTLLLAHRSFRYCRACEISSRQRNCYFSFCFCKAHLSSLLLFCQKTSLSRSIRQFVLFHIPLTQLQDVCMCAQFFSDYRLFIIYAPENRKQMSSMAVRLGLLRKRENKWQKYISNNSQCYFFFLFPCFSKNDGATRQFGLFLVSFFSSIY